MTYLQSGEEIRNVSFAFPSGAPARVHHSLVAPAGEIDVYAEGVRADGKALFGVAHVHSPAEGQVLIRMPVR